MGVCYHDARQREQSGLGWTRTHPAERFCLEVAAGFVPQVRADLVYTLTPPKSVPYNQRGEENEYLAELLRRRAALSEMGEPGVDDGVGEDVDLGVGHCRGWWWWWWW